MATVERDKAGRYVVRGTRPYGAYRTAEMAAYRLRQLAASTRPRRAPRGK